MVYCNNKSNYYTGPCTGLFFQYHRQLCTSSDHHGERVIFTPISSGCTSLPDSSMNFLKQNEEDGVEVIDSCNGFVLCSNDSVSQDGLVNRTFSVCNPMTKETVLLPDPARKTSNNRMYLALAAHISFDMSRSSKLRYEVLCLCTPEFEDSVKEQSWTLSALSSETGQWVEVVESDGKLPPMCDESLMGSRVYFNGSLFWDCLEGHILVYHLNNKPDRVFEVIEAPRAPMGRCLWQSEGNLHCYCHGFPDEYPAYALSWGRNQGFAWVQENSFGFRTLTEKLIIRFNADDSLIKHGPQYRFKVIGYASESNTMIISVPGIVVYAYRFGKFKTLWSNQSCRSNMQMPSSVLPYVHSSASIRTIQENNDSILCKNTKREE